MGWVVHDNKVLLNGTNVSLLHEYGLIHYAIVQGLAAHGIPEAEAEKEMAAAIANTKADMENKGTMSDEDIRMLQVIEMLAHTVRP